MCQLTLERPRASSTSQTIVEPKLDTTPILPHDPVGQMVVEFQSSRCPKLHDQIAREMLPTLDAMASRVVVRAGFTSPLAKEDLLQYGAIGLSQAIETFEVSYNVKFATYASPRINGAMFDGLRESDILTRRDRALARQALRAVDSLGTAGVFRPTEEEIQVKTGLSAKQVARGCELLRSSTVVSLEELSKGGQGEGAAASQGSTAEILQQTREAAVDRGAKTEDIWRVIKSCLPRDEAFVLEKLVRDEARVVDVAAELGVVKSRISQLKHQALTRLRELFAEGKPDHAWAQQVRAELFSK